MIASSRFLYDPDFVASNCTLPYDESTNLDTTIGTYTTNYAIGVVALAGFVACLVRKHSKWLAWYFVLTGAGYVVAGAGHQIIDTTTDDRRDAFESSSHVLVIAGVLALQLSIIFATKVRALLLVITAAVLVVDIVLHFTVIFGAYYALSLLIIGVYYVWKCWRARHETNNNNWWHIVSTLGCWTIVAGLLVQVRLAGVCGDAGYETCWQNCPLGDPMVFNHNALFHVLVAIGLLLQAFGTYPDKNSSNKKKDAEAEEDEKTVPNVSS